MLLLNAGAALYVAGLAGTIGDGVKRAADELDSGRVRTKLQQVAAVSRRIKTELATAEAATATT